MNKLTNELNNETVLRSQTDIQVKTAGQCNSLYNKFTHSINPLNLKNHIACLYVEVKLSYHKTV